MRLLILADIHANYIALKTLLREIERTDLTYDRIICLGDIIGRYESPGETWNLLRGANTLFACAGNHEEALAWLLQGRTTGHTLNRAAALAEALNMVLMRRAELEDDLLDFWENPLYRGRFDIKQERDEFDLGSFDLVLAHGTPHSANGMDADARAAHQRNTYLSPHPMHEQELCNALRSVAPENGRQTLIFTGHTHLPMFVTPAGNTVRFDAGANEQGAYTYFVLNGRNEVRPEAINLMAVDAPVTLINAGSVGDARRSAGTLDPADPRPLAHAVWLDTHSGEMYFLAAPYDLNLVRIRMNRVSMEATFEDSDYRLTFELLRELYRTAPDHIVQTSDQARFQRYYRASGEFSAEDWHSLYLSGQYDESRVPMYINDLWFIEQIHLLSGLENTDTTLIEKPYAYHWDLDAFRLRAWGGAANRR